MKPILAFFAIAGAMTLLASCGDSEEALTGPLQPTGASGRIAYSSVQSTIQQKCLRCHTGYADSVNVAAASVAAVAAVEDGSMPQGEQLSAVQKATLVAWLKQAEASAPPPPAKPITNTAGRVEFSSVAPIVIAKCAICHSGFSDSARLSSSAATVQVTIEASWMPYPGPTPLTPVQRATLLTWLKQEQGL